MSCDVCEVTERLESELCSFSNLSFASPTAQALHLSHLASRSWCFRPKSRNSVSATPGESPGVLKEIFVIYKKNFTHVGRTFLQKYKELISSH